MKQYEFKSALSHMNTFHGIHMNSDNFEEIALHGWDKIGNKRMALYVYKGKTQDKKIQIPCNTYYIEAVTSETPDFLKPDNTNSYDYTNLLIENHIEATKNYPTPLYLKGRLLHYHVEGENLVFPSDYESVQILYKGVILDEEGFPFLTYKEVEAIATYCAYVETRKQGMISKDRSTLEVSQILKQEWERSCAHARSPEFINQNEWNDLLEAKNTWDRKKFNVSFKPLSR